MARTPQQASEVPKYRLTGPGYYNDVLYDQTAIDRAGDKGISIFFTGIPNHSMEPLNEAAEAMVDKYKPEYVDPLAPFTVIGGPTPGSTPTP